MNTLIPRSLLKPQLKNLPSPSRSKLSCLARALLCGSALFFSAGTFAADSELLAMDAKLQQQLQHYCEKTAPSSQQQQITADGLVLLLSQDGRDKLAKHIQQLCSYRRQFDLILDHEQIGDVAHALYQHNLFALADTLLEQADYEGLELSSAQIRFAKAKQLFAWQRWHETIDSLRKIEAVRDLSKNQAEYSYFMSGSSLQMLLEHREAMRLYKAVPPGSDYYLQAQINLAVANIRQGWWTDAHLILRDLEKSLLKNKNYERFDQSQLILAYSQLQNEYYKDARESFRRIGLDSSVGDQALLGLGLTAMHQEQHGAALNAFKLLKQRQVEQKSEGSLTQISEAPLLVAYSYELMGEAKLAETEYYSASAYYQKWENKLLQQQQKAKQSNSGSELFKLFAEGQRSLNTSSPDKHSGRQQWLKANFDLLAALQSSAAPNKQLDQLQQQHIDYLKQLVIDQLQLQKDIAHSYLSQCRFAMAKLYDKD
ncbi:hypothetical protein [Agaribacterium haliotis]|uniref:hypothetical protein n=1 Tax=Agaribacterium haliotis TaxID=2013869 RepID=UPI000BB54BD2|nr:hypothetical protein [Agaribacterium haliotis]